MFLAGSSGPSFSTKAPPSSAKPQAQPWQPGRPTSAQNKPWMPTSGSGSAPKAPSAPQPAGTQPTKPNYNLNFSSVIGGREERGVRGPGFGKRHWVKGKRYGSPKLKEINMWLLISCYWKWKLKIKKLPWICNIYAKYCVDSLYCIMLKTPQTLISLCCVVMQAQSRR